MSKKSYDDLGKKLGDIAHSTLRSGDLSRLKDIGPTLQEGLRDIPGINLSYKNGSGGPPYTTNNEQGNHTPQNPPQGVPYAPSPRPMPPQRAAWQGSGQMRKMGPSGGTGVASIVLGILGMVATGICALVFGIIGLATTSLAFGIAAGAALLGFGTSWGFMGGGFSRRSLAGRVRKYYALLAQNSVQTFENLALHTGFAVDKVKKDIKKAMNKRMMPDIRVDVNETCIMQGEGAYKQYLETEQARKEREAEEAERERRRSDPATAGMEAFREEGAATIAKIRAANAAIPGEEISAKLLGLQTTTSKIFEYVEKHPEKLPDTRRFMSYYLPTTLKLVEKYRQYDEMDVQVASIMNAKKEIEETLDTIDTAFYNLLDSLYQDDKLDVSTDIEVLQAVLEQEGLTGKKFDIQQDDRPSF